jgi:thioredoxin 1
MATPVAIDETTFQQTVLQSDQPVLVDFTAEWCPPCKRLAPVLEELSAEYAGHLLFTTLDTDENINLTAQYGVQSMPTMIIFRAGREVQRIVGFVPKPQLKRQIDRALGVAVS